MKSLAIKGERAAIVCTQIRSGAQRLRNSGTAILSGLTGGWKLRQVMATSALICVAAVGSAQSVSKLTFTPASVAGGTTSVGTLTISKKANSDGLSVALSSANSAVASVPQSVHVPSGSTSVTFSVSTSPVSTKSAVVIKATSGTSSASGTLTVTAPTLTAFSLLPTTITGGSSLLGTVKISSAAPATGLVIKLTSSANSISVPATITIPGGATTTEFETSTSPVTAKATVKVTATLGTSSISTSMTLNPITLTGFTVSPTTVAGGSSATGTVTLSGNAPANGFAVGLSSSSPSASVPATVTVPSGASTATFSVATTNVTAQAAVKLTAKLGSSSLTASLTITAAPSFAGSYTGSFFSTGSSTGPCSFSVSSTGSVSGSATDYTSTSPTVVKLSGSISSSSASITTTSTQGTNTSNGFAMFTPSGYLVLVLKDNSNGGGSPSTTTVTAGKSSQPLEYAGSYSGTSLDSNGDVRNAISNLTITTGGSITASTAGSGSATGKINSSGVANVTLISSDGTKQTQTAYFAFDESGFLNGFVMHSDGSTTTIALTKSFAGSYQIPAGGNTIAMFTVSDTGVVSGSSNDPTNPFTVKGTISTNGTVNITATPTGSGNNGGVATITGSFSAVTGGFVGNGSISVVDGQGGTWSGTGIPSAGLLVAGTYHLSVQGGLTAVVTISPTGFISGSSVGVSITGSLAADGEMIIFLTPVTATSSVYTNTLIGSATLTGKILSASGSSMDLTGATSTWTLTKTTG